MKRAKSWLRRVSQPLHRMKRCPRLWISSRGRLQTLGPLASIGVATFGPLDPRPASTTYGRILSTPKPGWTNADIVGPLHSAFDAPIGFDTDVNGAALGEWRWGAAQGLDTFIYLTIGTGIGGGGLVNGELMHGLLHPEMGHIPLPHDKALIRS